MKLLLGGAATAITALLAAAGSASADPLPSTTPHHVSVDGPFYGGVPRYTMCVAPCSFTASAPTFNIVGDPYTFSGAGRWELAVQLSGGDDNKPTIVPATSPTLGYVATELGLWGISYKDEANKVLAGVPGPGFLVVSKADAPDPIKFLSSKTVKLGSVIRVRSPKTRVKVIFTRGKSQYETRGRYAMSARGVRCSKRIKNVHCLKVNRLHPDLLPPTGIVILAWSNSVIGNIFSDGVADRKLVKVKVLNKS